MNPVFERSQKYTHTYDKIMGSHRIGLDLVC
jgi:hypothetical protein